MFLKFDLNQINFQLKCIKIYKIKKIQNSIKTLHTSFVICAKRK